MSERFEVLEKLGEGGMGVVYRARDLRHGREVALKVLKGASERHQARFQREARALARLQHPGIVRAFEFTRHDGDPCLVLQYLPGQSLLELLARRGPLPPQEAVSIVAQVGEALVHVHAQGILHRDLKPENVVLHDGRPVLLDFGLCKASTEGDARVLTLKHMGVGSPGYAAPEQINDAHNVDALSDVYGLGATLYALLCARPPFVAEHEHEVLLATLKQDPQPPSTHNPAVDPALDALCLRCLEKEPRRRYRSAAALVADLQAYLRGEALSEPEELISSGDTLPPTEAFAKLMEVGFSSDDLVAGPRTPSQHGQVGDAQVEAGDFAAAAASYRKALAGEDDPAVRLKLAYALRRGGQPRESLEAYTQVLAVWPDDYRVHVGRGAARANLEDFAGAAVDFRRALKAVPREHPERRRIKSAYIAASKKVRETKLDRVRLVAPPSTLPPPQD